MWVASAAAHLCLSASHHAQEVCLGEDTQCAAFDDLLARLAQLFGLMFGAEAGRCLDLGTGSTRLWCLPQRSTGGPAGVALLDEIVAGPLVNADAPADPAGKPPKDNP